MPTRRTAAKQLPIFVLPIAVILVLALHSHAASRISGTYVHHGPNFAEMLQLTQIGNGQINGVFSSVQLKDGNIQSEQVPVTAVLDGDQLMFTVHSFLSFLVGPNVAGTTKGSAIELQIVDSKGTVTSPLFVHSSPEQFKAYADALKSKRNGIVLSNNLLSNAQELREWNRKGRELDSCCAAPFRPNPESGRCI